MIPLFKVKMTDEAISQAVRVLQSGYLGQGARVEEFEKNLTPWFGTSQTLTTNSGTSAIHLALRLAGVGPGDEIITTPMTCAATCVPILERGATVVWADIDPNTGNIDPKSVQQKLSARTKALLVVHWGGYPCELDELKDLAKTFEIAVIEDAAHAFGAKYKNKFIGGISTFTAFSFQAIKHLTTGDGGALTCERESDYKRGKLLRWYGIDREGSRKDFRCEEDILDYGYKFHMNDIAAGIGLGQLPEVEKTLNAHRENAQFYRNYLQSTQGVKLLNRQNDRLSSDWLFTFRSPKRDELVKRLNAEGVMSSQVHTRIDHHTAFHRFRSHLPGVDEFSREQLNIPVGWWLTEEEREFIAQKVVKCSKQIL
jgi:perosamine synthetase